MTEETERLGSVRVLVIDDNVSIHEDFRKILAADPNPNDALAQAEILLFGETGGAPSVPNTAYELQFCSQGRQGAHCVRRALEAGIPFSLAFVDMRMPPGWDGLETIEEIWAIDSDIQIVICSAHSDHDWNDLIKRIGHTDKLLVLKKPFEPIEVLQCASALSRKWCHERLLRAQVDALEHVVITRTEKLEDANRQLRHLATHDALTGLPNRVLLDDRIAQAIAHAHRAEQPFAVLMLDLDRFKLINDTSGHRAGDAVLTELGMRLSSIVRDIDTVARIGGDEFVIVMSPPAARQDALDLARRANDALRTTMRIGDKDIHVTASIGLSVYPEDGLTDDSLLTRADAAMYCVKTRGRNDVQSFTAGMDAVTTLRASLESDLHQALRRGELELFYQPKVDTGTGEVFSAEALLRWHHPQRGLINPDDFIPLAEETGLIHDIGAWVLQEACRQCFEWQQQGLPALRMAVNVAATQFRRGNLMQVIRHALEQTGLEPQFLEIELTESAVMLDAEESATILQQLSRMGVLVSVDDFGTGYSSIAYLRRFPIDKLKIDRAFVQDLGSKTEDALIIKAIISLAHSLRLKVVAEGVETPEQLSFLRSFGCDQYQGFHFSPPLPANEFSAKLSSWHALEDAATRTHSKLAVRRWD
jgi:diguanylate cyclase (GGDEF)-like protein